MRLSLSHSRPVLIAGVAVIAGVALYAALQLGSGGPSMNAGRPDPLAVSSGVPDQTAETGAADTRVIRLEEIDRMAAQKLGEKPRLAGREELARLSADTSGTDARRHAERISEIRRTQGSAAALAALRAARTQREAEH